MDRFKTFSRRDPEFLAYLDGSFSSTHRALPVRSLNVDTLREQVTFEIVPLNEIPCPALWQILWTAIRPQSLIFSMGPLLVAWLYAWSRGYELNPRLAVSTVIGILFFHVGMNFLDDYFDHRKGRDRLNPRGGSRAIQNGWLPGRSMFQAGLGLVGLAILFGLPVVLNRPSLLFVVALTALAAGLGYSSSRVRLKYRGLGEVTTFLLAGPLLTSGFAWAASGGFSWDFVVLGSAFGFTAVIYYHLKNIENIMVDSQANARTLAARLGFDSAKKLVWILAGLSGLSILVFDWIVSGAGLYILAFAAHALVLVPVARRLVAAPSPLSSELQEIRRKGLALHWATCFAIALCVALDGLMSHGSGLGG